MKIELINQAETEAEAEWNRFLLLAVFYPALAHRRLEEDLITNLNNIVNKYIRKFGGDEMDRDTWRNIFDEERQGIARDKLSNIFRVIRTEIQEKYNAKLFRDWENNPNIIGKRIRLSRIGKNHCEICKNMVGAYPLSFKWVSFHVNCLCEVFPIYGKPGTIVKMPNRAIKFVDLNRSRFDGWKTKPDWLDNF